MARDCDALVAVWDHTPGGTANCLAIIFGPYPGIRVALSERIARPVRLIDLERRALVRRMSPEDYYIR